MKDFFISTHKGMRTAHKARTHCSQELIGNGTVGASESVCWRGGYCGERVKEYKRDVEECVDGSEKGE